MKLSPLRPRIQLQFDDVYRDVRDTVRLRELIPAAGDCQGAGSHNLCNVAFACVAILLVHWVGRMRTMFSRPACAR